MSPRRTWVALPWGMAACWAFGIALGIGLSHVWPWGFAPPPPRVEDTPRPGVLLSVGADSAMVASGSVADLADGSRLAVVMWLRGPRDGREVIRVSGCDTGAGFVESLTHSERRQAWHSRGAGILDQLAAATCHGIEPARPARPTT